MTNGKILVTGANGTVGSEVVRQLAAEGRMVRALVRDPAKTPRFGSGVEVVAGDLSKPETLAPVFAGAASIFVLTNGVDLSRLEANAFAAAARAGASHIVKLSGRHVDADFMADTVLARAHQESENRLRTLGIPWTILRPGFFSSNFLLWLDRAKDAVLLPVGEARDTPTDPRDIAAVAVKVLTTPGHDGRIYELTGPQFLTYADMVGRIGAVMGRQVKLVDVPPQAARDGMVAGGVPPSQADALLRYFAAARAQKVWPPTATIADLLGRPPRSFDEWTRDSAAALRGQLG